MKLHIISGKRTLPACFVCLACVSAAMPVWAEPVDASGAALAAQGWFKLRFQAGTEQSIAETGPAAVLTPELARPLRVKGRLIAHAFDVPGGGSIAIAADDRQAPILYYSPHHRLQSPHVPPALEILESFADKISQFEDENKRAKSTDAPHSLWAALTGLSDPRGNVAALGILPSIPKGPLVTTTWNQDEPYNDECPLYQDQRCVVGCVATAMAQVMRYWQHPQQGSGNRCYYWALGKTSVCANFGITTYDWANMPDKLTVSSPQAAKDAVATLCYHCGVAVEMDYSPYGSGAWHYSAASAFTYHFGYQPARFLGQVGGTDIEVWYGMMCEQIDRGQPVLYGTETHEFILDGYDAPNLVHLNMGWGGEEDGWYAIDHFPLDSAMVDAVVDIRPYHFELTAILKTATDEAQIRWTSLPGDSFTVWSCPDLLAPDWTEEADVSAQSTTASWTDTSAIAGAKFYRVERKD